MAATQQEILMQLKKDILPLQGLVPLKTNHKADIGWGNIDHAFPHHQFPVAATHEFICNDAEQTAASIGFIAAIIRSLIIHQGVCAWITHHTTIFPHGLIQFGIRPEQILFIEIPDRKNILWAVEEVLQCAGLTAVVAEVPYLDFTASRRLQLAVEKSKATGFIIRPDLKNINITACISRWRIHSLPGIIPNELPGVGFPAWNVELLKIRNGKPGSWQLQWSNHQFQPLITEQPQKEKPVILRTVSFEQKTG